MIDVGKLGELLAHWHGIPLVIIPPNALPPDDAIPERDGWQVWKVGLGHPREAYPTLAAAVAAELEEAVRIERQVRESFPDGVVKLPPEYERMKGRPLRLVRGGRSAS